MDKGQRTVLGDVSSNVNDDVLAKSLPDKVRLVLPVVAVRTGTSSQPLERAPGEQCAAVRECTRY